MWTALNSRARKKVLVAGREPGPDAYSSSRLTDLCAATSWAWVWLGTWA